MARTKSRWVNSRLTFYNGPMELSTGCYIVDENVWESTAADTLKAGSLNVINTTHARTLPTPEDGLKVDVLFHESTKQMVVKCGSGALINNSTLNDVVAVAFTSGDTAEIGHHICFWANSTSNWFMLNSAPDKLNTVSFTSST